MRALVTGLFLCLLVSACAGGSDTSVASAAAATSTAVAAEDEDQLGASQVYPYANELLPSDMAMAYGNNGIPILAVVGHRQVQILGPDAEPISRVPAEFYGEYAFVTAVVTVDGSFVVAIGGEEPSSPLLPELLRWSESASTWLPITTYVTQPAAYRTASGSAATPPSPPFAGGAAIMDMTVHDDVIWATGWTTTTQGVVRAALWKSVDAVNWTLELIPEVGTSHGPEYGAGLSVNDLAVVVSLGNATHYGAGTIGRLHGGSWEPLPFPTTTDASSIARVVDSDDDTAWIIEQFFWAPDVLHVSKDMVEWQTIELPELEARINDEGHPQGGFWSLDADHAAGPVAWFSTHQWGESMMSEAWQWSDEAQAFDSTTIPGNYVGSAEGFVVTQQIGNFVVAPASELLE